MTTVHPVNTDIARNIRAVLAVYDLPQKTLVDWLQIHEGQVSKLMANRQEWRVTHLASIAAYVQVPLAVLIGPTADLVKALPANLPSLLAANPHQGVTEQAGRQGDQFPILGDVQFVTVGTCEVATRHQIAA